MRYEGGWAHGLRDGFGVTTYNSGARWEGTWKGGLRHGRGQRVLPSGEQQVGTWIHGEQVGQRWSGTPPAHASRAAIEPAAPASASSARGGQQRGNGNRIVPVLDIPPRTEVQGFSPVR